MNLKDILNKLSAETLDQLEGIAYNGDEYSFKLSFAIKTDNSDSGFWCIDLDIYYGTDFREILDYSINIKKDSNDFGYGDEVFITKEAIDFVNIVLKELNG